MHIKLRSKALLASLLTIVALAGAPTATVFAGYAPSGRATFTCNTPTDCPGANYVVFNSFTNAPNYGDERAFFDGKDAGDTSANGYLDKVTVHDGQRLTLRVYIHNNANPGAIGVAAATAHNTSLQVLLPLQQLNNSFAAATVRADNANPVAVSDTVDFTAATPFTVDFDTTQPVQITYRPNGTGSFVTRTLPGTSIVNANHVLNANFGDWNGCFNFSALVTMTVLVHMPSTPPPPTPPTPPVTPPTTTTTNSKGPAPTQLVNTGPGEVAGIFAATTVAGGLSYRWMLSRRLSRQ
jgi:hypothetical protein